MPVDAQLPHNDRCAQEVPIVSNKSPIVQAFRAEIDGILRHAAEKAAMQPAETGR